VRVPLAEDVIKVLLTTHKIYDDPAIKRSFQPLFDRILKLVKMAFLNRLDCY
jgi:hypothetical protein